MGEILPVWLGEEQKSSVDESGERSSFTSGGQIQTRNYHSESY
jgi:hypothetical protein